MNRWLAPLTSVATVALFTLTALTSGVLSGCGSSGTDCSAAAGNAVAVVRASLEAETEASEGDDKRRKNKEAMLPALKEELVKHCKSEKWSTALKECIAKAKVPADLEACDPDKSLSDPDKSLSDPDKGLSDPDKSLSDPDKSLSDPDKGLSDPDKGLSDPDKSLSDPREATDSDS